jgi:hypothetical protein
MPHESPPARRLRLDWPNALLFFTADPHWRRKIAVGGLVLLTPVVGWPAVLGFRKEAIFRLIRGDDPVLPEWRGNFAHLLGEGLKAVAVINGYYLPVYLWMAFRLIGHPAAEHIPWVWIALVALAMPIFSTLIVPAVLAADRLLAPEPAFSTGESLAIAIVFGLLTFVIPSAFLNVSRTGRIVSAFDLPRALRRIAREPREYLEAWIGSGLVSLAGHFSGVLAPWGVVWCYLAIVYAFNEVPLAAGDPEASYLRGSWFARRPTGAG